jgi:hypothetical protein
MKNFIEFSVSADRLTRESQRDLNLELNRLLGVLATTMKLNNPYFQILLIDRRSGDDERFNRLLQLKIDPIGDDKFFNALNEAEKTEYQNLIGQIVYLLYKYGYSTTQFRVIDTSSISIVDFPQSPQSCPPSLEG